MPPEIRLSPAIRLQCQGSTVPPKMKLAPRGNVRLHEMACRDSWLGCRYQSANCA